MSSLIDRMQKHPPGTIYLNSLSFLFEDHFGVGVDFAGGGEDDGGGEDERASEPGGGAEVIAEQLDAENGAERRLDVEEDSGARCGDVMDAPVP